MITITLKNQDKALLSLADLGSKKIKYSSGLLGEDVPVYVVDLNTKQAVVGMNVGDIVQLTVNDDSMEDLRVLSKSFNLPADSSDLLENYSFFYELKTAKLARAIMNAQQQQQARPAQLVRPAG